MGIMRILPKVGTVVWLRSANNRDLKAIVRKINEWEITLHFTNYKYNNETNTQYAMNRNRVLYHRAFWEVLVRIDHG